MLGDARKPWTEQAAMPGGDLGSWGVASGRPDTDFERFLAEVNKRYPWLDASHARRMARAYGSRIERVLAQSAAAMGDEIASGLYEAELDYLRREEWATNADDVLWRRSKLGLHLTPAERQRVADWMEDGKQMKKVA
jgi:glycerol-3-phosphate dehydrogenase